MSRVLLFSFTAMANPTLVAATTVMLLLPSPKKLMLGYLLGAYLMSITLGCVIVFALGNSGAVSTAKHTVNPLIDLVIGALFLVIGFALGTGRDRPLRERRAHRRARQEPKKTPRWQQALGKGDPRITFAVGAVLTLPGASYLAALDALIKLHYNTVDAVLTIILVNMIMLALIEVPLLSFTIAPDWTPRALERVKATFREHGHTMAFVAATVLGSLLVLRGVITLLT
jgi:Sap, sulfolipid-1-addressing protein